MVGCVKGGAVSSWVCELVVVMVVVVVVSGGILC